MKKITGTYCDLDINFDRNPITGDVAVRRDEEAIKRSLRNLLLLKGNEKPFHPEINSGVMDLLFQPTDPITVMELKTRIGDMIRQYEPRVMSASVDITDNIDRNEIRIVIHFTIKNVQKVFSMTMAVERLR